MRTQLLSIITVGLLGHSAHAETPKKPLLTATCTSLVGFAIGHKANTVDEWTVSPDGYVGDTYAITVEDDKNATVRVKSKLSPMTYAASVLDSTPDFVTIVGLEVKRPVLLTLYKSGLLAYVKQTWSSTRGRAETQAFYSSCVVQRGAGTGADAQ